jgi:hypothetical protein
MNKINNKNEINNIDEFIKANKNKINKTINTNKVEIYYNYIRDLFFDNFTLIFIFYLLILPHMFKQVGVNKKFNYWMIFAIVGLIIIHYLAKIFYRQNSKFGNLMRTNECLNSSNHIIFNKTIKPIESNKELLSKPLNEFIINTSHNTYIPCTQNIDVASSEAIKRALGMGARVIELDCFANNNTGKNPKDFEPIVAHGVQRSSGDIFTTSKISFEECIDVIATYGFLTSDPLIVCLELNTNNLIPTQKRIKEIIKSKLGDKLLSPEYKISNKTNRKYFVNEPIKNLLNKVIFIGEKDITNQLTDIIDGTFGEANLVNSNHLDKKLISNVNTKEQGIIQRVYPAGNISGHLSYNYDPSKFWKNKNQMVALNFQLVDDNLMKNVAMFKNSSFVHFSQFSIFN